MGKGTTAQATARKAASKAAWGVGALALAASSAGLAAAQDLMGQPTPGGIDLQPAAAPLKHDAIFFHNIVLMPVITVITLLVLGLLIWIVVRYNKRANPTPARWSHNTTVEIIWTVAPVVILVGIALFSFRLLFAYHDMPEPDLTVKVTGNQWNWAYEYPDQAVPEYISNMLPEAEAQARGVPYRLAADEPMVVPVGQTVRLLVTAADVIHSLGLPAFGLKTDAVPGRVNETWFKAERTGVFYGQCSELCGVDHAFMPIQINVVTQAEFERWVVSKGGSMTPPGAAPAGGTAAQNAAGTTGSPVIGQASTGPTQGATTQTGQTQPVGATADIPQNPTEPATPPAQPAAPAAAAPAAQ